MEAAGKKKSSFWGVVLFLAALGALFVAGVNMLVKPSASGDGILSKTSFAKNKVALVRLEGVIMDSRKVVDQLDRWADDGSAKAIVLRIDSPGGGVAPSQEIYNALKRADAKKPVIASMGTVAASGGYYAAAACRKVMAEPGTITGSIGVIMFFSDMRELMDKIGLGTVVIKSGRFKDTGSPYRPFTDADRELMQGVVDDIYNQFITDVSEGRSMELAKVKELADGRIYTGRQALELGLVDELGGLKEAIDLAGKMAGIEGEPEVMEKKKKPGMLEWLMGEDFEIRAITRLAMPTGLYYLWPAW
ncbi:MAG: signal peptide peptidase SppA [Candidatus Nitrospinota bacterium M3_3B_026]